MNSTAAGAMTLREYTSMLKSTIALTPQLQGRWVTAELSDMAVRGGHCYFELVEKSPSGQTVAKIRATVWQSVYMRLRAKFISATGREFTSGMKLMLRGSANIHEVFGLSFNVIDIDPTYTLGDIERIRREILARLTAEGIIDMNRNLEPPIGPQKIAIVSAAGAAGYGDFINQLDSNQYGIKFYHALFPAIMQGENAARSVCEALERIEMSVDFWDCVVIIRGGGASTDLLGFDNLELARAVATYPIPILVGIGHERDRTVLDEIACIRVKTPTAAAEYILKQCVDTYSRISNLCRLITDETSQRLQGAMRQTAWLHSQVNAAGSTAVQKALARLRSIAAMLPAAADKQLSLQTQRLGHFFDLIKDAGHNALLRETRKLDNLKSLMEALSPEQTLRRGYSITTVNGKALRDINDAPPGSHIITRVLTGEIESTVTKHQ